MRMVAMAAQVLAAYSGLSSSCCWSFGSSGRLRRPLSLPLEQTAQARVDEVNFEQGCRLREH